MAVDIHKLTPLSSWVRVIDNDCDCGHFIVSVACDLKADMKIPNGTRAQVIAVDETDERLPINLCFYAPDLDLEQEDRNLLDTYWLCGKCLDYADPPPELFPNQSIVRWHYLPELPEISGYYLFNFWQWESSDYKHLVTQMGLLEYMDSKKDSTIEVWSGRLYDPYEDLVAWAEIPLAPPQNKDGIVYTRAQLLEKCEHGIYRMTCSQCYSKGIAGIERIEGTEKE